MTIEKTEIAKRFGLPEAPPVTDADAVVINSGPAFFVNKFFTTTMPQGLRLTFAEVNPALSDAQFRTAVFLSPLDAAALADLLQRQLMQLERVEVPQQAGDSGEPT